MTPALLTLARHLVALPGFPSCTYTDTGLCIDTPAGPRFLRADDGLLWLLDPDRPATMPPTGERYLIDLADPSGATGGVLLNLIPPTERWRIRPLGNGLYGANLAELGGMGSLCPTLAEACARVLVAIGRVG